MEAIKKQARVAGFLYLLIVLVGPLRLIYIPSKLFVTGDATATAGNILAHEMLFRLGMLSDLVGGALLVYLVMALYRLFRDVDQKQAVLMVILGGVMPACICLVNVVNDAAALLLIRGADFLQVFDKPQRDALAMLFLRLHYQEIVAAMTLWGLWLFPLAILTYKSGFLPRWLGIWLALNGLAYLAQSVIGELFPQYTDMLSNVAFPVQFGEIAFMLWLLIMGTREQAPNSLREMTT
jgi:hypothetical protein